MSPPAGAMSTPVPMPSVWSRLKSNVSAPELGLYVAVSVFGASPSAASSRSSRPWMLEKLKSLKSTLPSPLPSGFVESPLLNSGSRIWCLNSCAYESTWPSVIDVNGICCARKLWLAIEVKKPSIWLSIDMISFGPALLKLDVKPFEKESSSVEMPPSLDWNWTLAWSGCEPVPNSCTVCAVKSLAKEICSVAWASGTVLEPAILRPASIEAVSVIGLETDAAPSTMPSGLGEFVRSAGVMPLSPGLWSVSWSVSEPPSEIVPEEIVAESRPIEMMRFAADSVAFTARSTWPPSLRNGPLGVV